MSDPEIRKAAEAIFADLLGESILSTTIEAHREIKRSQVVCGTCGTMCRAHVPLQPLVSGATSAAASREGSPAARAGSTRPNGFTVGPEKGTGGGTGIGSGAGRIEGGNVFFDCLVCQRSVVYSRYAPHLASCLGMTGSTRRGASRMAAAKARLGANDRASPSPYLASENDSDVDSVGGKRKKFANGSKRGGSPTKATLAKKTKLLHGHTSGSAPPSISRAPHPPSKLGRPPTTKAHSASPFSPEKEKSVPAKSAREREREREKEREKERDRREREREGSAASTLSRNNSKTTLDTRGWDRGGSSAPSVVSVAGRSSSGDVEPPPPPVEAPPPPPPGDESSEGDDDY